MGEPPVTRPRTIRLLRLPLLVAAAAGAGWLASVQWFERHVPRAVIPVGAGQRGKFAGNLVFAPDGAVAATIAGVAPGPNEPLAVRLWDCRTGKLRAELLRCDQEGLPSVDFSFDTKLIRVRLQKPDEVRARAESGKKRRKAGSVCWNVESAIECDADEPFRPVRGDCPPWDDQPGWRFWRLRSLPPRDYAPAANAWVFLGDDRLRILFAGDRDARRIVDTPWGSDTIFAVSPDATQLVMNGPPRTRRGPPWLVRVWNWLDPEFGGPSSIDKTVTHVVDVADGSKIVSWEGPYVRRYQFSPDGRTLAVIGDEQTAFYDAPFRGPWPLRLATALGAGAATFLVGRVIRRRGHP
jgi:hypothetical protein